MKRKYVRPENIRKHMRDLAELIRLGGIVGVSLCPSHLRDTSLQPATAEDVFAHVDYYLSLGGQDIVGFGADWDGTDLPQGFSSVKDLEQVAAMALVAGLRHGNSGVSDAEGKAKAMKEVKALAEKFSAEHGSIVCKELIARGKSHGGADTHKLRDLLLGISRVDHKLGRR